MASEGRPEGAAPSQGVSRQTLVRAAIAALIVIAVAWFALANSQRVEIDYLLGTRDVRLVYVIAGAAVLGALADRLLQLAARRRRH